MAEALEVGKEAWGLSELGTKAGVPPGRGRRQTDTHESCLSYLQRYRAVLNGIL